MESRVLVTGATSGIGWELARLFAKDGHALVLVSRPTDRLEAAAERLRKEFRAEVAVMPFDLAKPEAAEALADALAQGGMEIDVLVNNAGAGALGPFGSRGPEKEREALQLLLGTPLELCARLGKAMAARGRGRVLNVASTAAFQPGPYMATYYAAKAGLVSFSEALHEELRHQGVTVTCLCPGPTRTGFNAAAGVRESWLVRATSMEAERAARAGYEACLAGRRLAVPGLLNNLGLLGVRLAPRGLVLRVMGILQGAIRRPEA